ncbi:hypothetical protein B9Q10_00770 [Candidatus Marsarchaeota G2 archaeon ECH_B_SAG-E12]|nr:MAG: hypothetical protein B9Q10_00770 [Candidatus Marsarchaeota G2 archaeon ECH_B_SAG-E12]
MTISKQEWCFYVKAYSFALRPNLISTHSTEVYMRCKQLIALIPIIKKRQGSDKTTSKTLVEVRNWQLPPERRSGILSMTT